MQTTIADEQELIDLIKNYNTHYMNLFHTKIHDIHVISIAEGLKQNNISIVLDLGDNKISDKGADILCDIFNKNENTTITTLVLSCNIIKQFPIKFNSTLTTIDLSGNLISDPGAIIIAEYLKNNKTLLKLDLSTNDINNTGAIAIAESLKYNTTLIILDVSWNQIVGLGIDAFFQLLLVNITIAELDITREFYDNTYYVKVRNQLKLNKYNRNIKNISLQQRCYQIIKNNNIRCPESYWSIYDNTSIKY